MVSGVTDYEGSVMKKPTHCQTGNTLQQVAPFISLHQVSPKGHGKKSATAKAFRASLRQMRYLFTRSPKSCRCFRCSPSVSLRPRSNSRQSDVNECELKPFFLGCLNVHDRVGTDPAGPFPDLLNRVLRFHPSTTPMPFCVKVDRPKFEILSCRDIAGNDVDVTGGFLRWR